MGQVSASSRESLTKLTITSLHGKHDPQACEQSGKLEPATSTVRVPPLGFLVGLSMKKKDLPA